MQGLRTIQIRKDRGEDTLTGLKKGEGKGGERVGYCGKMADCEGRLRGKQR